MQLIDIANSLNPLNPSKTANSLSIISSMRDAVNRVAATTVKATSSMSIAVLLYLVPTPHTVAESADFFIDTVNTSPVSGLYLSPGEDGWGMTLEQQVDIIFVTIYTYDVNGFPHWYVASDCPISGSGCTGILYEVTGGISILDAWDASNLKVEPVGTITFTFSDNDSGTVEYLINDTNSSRNFTRQVFAIDADGDGVSTRSDAFPNDPTETKDSDGDGVGDNTDNCVTDANSDQTDSDANGIGDACEPEVDSDGDGVNDDLDLFPNDPLETVDTDSDGVGDNGDNCPTDSNPDQADTDGDGVGDACEPVASAPTFAEVQSIFNANCVGCHGSNGGLTLSSSVSYNNLVNTPSQGLPTVLRVTPGSSDDSYLIWKLEGRSGIVGSRMPQGGALSASDIALIAAWIDAGANP
jgi:mono/diheme cytochrome c family protein